MGVCESESEAPHVAGSGSLVERSYRRIIRSCVREVCETDVRAFETDRMIAPSAYPRYQPPPLRVWMKRTALRGAARVIHPQA